MSHIARVIGTTTPAGKPLKWALFSQLFLMVYLQVVEWIPLGRWNNITNGNGQEATDIILAVLQAAILLYFY